MDEKKNVAILRDVASERAKAYAPRPRFEPGYAGLVGAAIATLIAGAFSVFVGVDPGAAFGWAALIGFLVPYLHLKSKEWRHFKAWHWEYEKLIRERQRPPRS